MLIQNKNATFKIQPLNYMFDVITKTLGKFFGSKSDKDLKELIPYIKYIHREHEYLLTLSDDELRGKSAELKKLLADHVSDIDQQTEALHQRIADEPDLNIDIKEDIFNQIDKLKNQRNQSLEEMLMQILPVAFAVVKETARRFKENKQLEVKVTDYDQRIAAQKPYITLREGRATWSNRWMAAGNQIVWDMVHYDMQLIGGIVLHQGKIAEMATGEGKTLVATLPAFLNAIAGRGVHIVTVNDYLAKRDAEWMAPIMEFHGLTVKCIDNYEPHSDERKQAYLADITYGTNNEFGFDYLRDNMARHVAEQVQRQHHFAMVDEVDSVLIDDARTPLIISGPVAKLRDHEFYDLKPGVERLMSAQKKLVASYLNDAKRYFSEANDEVAGLALLRAFRGLPKNKPLIKYLSEQGIRQKLQKTENIYLQENAKLMPQADKPLYFTIDEKNNTIDLTEKGIDLITGQGKDKSFFILPDISIEIDAVDKQQTLTDKEKIAAKEKIINDYTAKSERIHAVNQLLKAYTLFERDVDYIIADAKVKIVDEQTGRVLEGRRYSDGLHQALEAKENVKIEDATQTYATVTLQNYFRMYHKLAGMTGTAETEAGEFWQIYKLDVVVIPTNRAIVRDDRQDKVYKTVREKFNAVANEIQEMVKQGRPVLVGTTSVENSELLSRMLKFKKIAHEVLNAKQHAREAEIVASAGLPGNVTIATNMAGRGTDIKLTPESKASGGLAIIGTERHESRRVDRQLRGRSGRQGDPGSSQFFVSLEDNLMRLFGSDRIAKIMDRVGYEEGEVIQHSMITKSIERAQKKVEENNFSIRKRLLEYDDVMNSQRKVIYKRRRNALYGDRLTLDIMNSFYDIIVNALDVYQGDYDSFKLYLVRVLGMEADISEDIFMKNHSQLAAEIYEKAHRHYLDKNKAIKEQSFPIIAQVSETRGAIHKDIVVPFSDGTKEITIITDLQKSFQTKCSSLIENMEQMVTLAVIDQSWTEHLREMDELKQQVQNAVFEQKDPLLIYKFESFELFKSFVQQVNEETVTTLAKVQILSDDPQKVKEARQHRQSTGRRQLKESKRSSGSLLENATERQAVATGRPVEVTKPIRKEKSYGRNERVTVKYADGTMKADVKYKAIAQDISESKCVIVEK